MQFVMNQNRPNHQKVGKLEYNFYGLSKFARLEIGQLGEPRYGVSSDRTTARKDASEI